MESLSAGCGGLQSNSSALFLLLRPERQLTLSFHNLFLNLKTFLCSLRIAVPSRFSYLTFSEFYTDFIRIPHISGIALKRSLLNNLYIPPPPPQLIFFLVLLFCLFSHLIRQCPASLFLSPLPLSHCISARPPFPSDTLPVN